MYLLAGAFERGVSVAPQVSCASVGALLHVLWRGLFKEREQQMHAAGLKALVSWEGEVGGTGVVVGMRFSGPTREEYVC